MSGDPDATAAVDMRRLLGPAPDPATLVLGGRYRVESLIGTGGVASVVRAVDELLDRTVAVKLLRDSTDGDDDRARFQIETQTLARLSHPGLVTLLDSGVHEGRPYLVMELVDGPTLSAYLETPMGSQRLAGIAEQVATALAYAHEQGVIHRDVKPGNVLVRRDGRVKLADFGIARVIGDHSHHTRTGTVVGSVHYLAPEQVGFEEITPAVDVYALGLLLLRALTGRHAFEGPTIETALARLNADPEVPDDLPSGWRELITAMTARDPEDRPSAHEVADRLAWLAGERPTTKVLPPLPLAATHERRVHDRMGDARLRVAGLLPRLRAAPLLAAAVVVALVLVLNASLSRGEPVVASEEPSASDASTGSEDTIVRAPAEPGDTPRIKPVAVTSDPPATARPTKAHRAGPAHAKPRHHVKPPHHAKPGKKPGKHKPGKGPGPGKGHGPGKEPKR